MRKAKRLTPALPLLGRAAESARDVALRTKDTGNFFLNEGDLLKIIGPELEAAGEVMPVIPGVIPFNAVTNMSVQAQETGANIPKLLRAALESLPFGKAATEIATKGPKAIPELDSLTAPANLRRPSELLYNVARAINPNFKEPEGFLPNLALDAAGGVLTGSPQAAAEIVSQRAAQAELMRGIQALKNNPERITRIRGKGAILRAPKQLSAPADLGPEGPGQFRIVPRDQAEMKIALRKALMQEAMKGQPKALPEPVGRGDNFEIVHPAEARRRMLEALRQKVQRIPPGSKPPELSSGAGGVPAEVPPISPPPQAPALDDYFSPSPRLSDEGKAFESQALDYFRNNHAKATEDYINRISKEFGSKRVVSGDEAKFIVPGVSPETMAAAHEPASAFSKVFRDKLLADPETAGKPVIIMGGGSGAGKTSSLRNRFSELDKDFAGVFDTNTNNVASGRKNIELVKKSGRPVMVLYVERDPEAAWGSVIDRGQRSGRPVPADIHIDNQGARQTFLKLEKEYRSDPKVAFKVLLNESKDTSKELSVAELKKMRYNSTEYQKALKGKLNDILDERIKTGQLSEQEASPYRFREEGPEAPLPGKQGNKVTPEGPSAGSPSESKLTPKQKLLNDIEDAKIIVAQRESAMSKRLKVSDAEKVAEALKADKSNKPFAFQMGKARVEIAPTRQALDDFELRVSKGRRYQRLKSGEIVTKKGGLPLTEWTPARLNDQLGFARVGKSFEGMSEEEARAEVKRLLKEAGRAGQKERKFIGTVREAPKTEKEVAARVYGVYEPISNKKTLEAASARVDANADEALRFVREIEHPTADSNATAQVLIDRFQKSGEYQKAIDLVEDLAAKATKQGQAIQALSMYSRLTPEGVLKFAQRVITRAKAARPGLELPGITPELAKQLTELAEDLQKATAPRQRAIRTARLLKAVHQQIPPTILQKVSMFQTAMQLLNPKTAIRNFLGNTGFSALENVSDTVAAGFDKAVSMATGRRTKVIPSLKIQQRGFAKGAREAIQDIEAGVRTSAASTQFQLPQGGIFKSRVGQALEKALRYELEVPDRAAFKAAYRGSLWNQMKAAGVRRPSDEMMEQAVYDGLYRTFQDDNAIAGSFSKIKTALNQLTGSKDFGIGDAVIKYPKTPGAILARGIDYSPAGFFKTILELAKPVVGKGFNQRAFVESASRAFVGSSLVGTGILMSKLGLITGHKKDKPGVRDLKREIGLGDYKLNVTGLKRFVMSGFDPAEARLKSGDVLATYDWFLPQAIDVAIGANIEENHGKPTGTVGTIADAISSGASTLAEQPLVSGVARFFGHGDVVEGAGETLKGIPSSFTPTLLNQVRLLVDDIRRNPDAENPLEEAANQVKMKVPGLSQQVPAKEAPLGGEQRIFKNGEKGAGKAAQVFLSPANLSKYGTSPDTKLIEELIRLDVPIAHQGKTLRGVDLTPQEIQSIQKSIGPIARALLNVVMNREEYQAATDLQKQKILEAAINESQTAAQMKNAIPIAKRIVGKKAA